MAHAWPLVAWCLPNHSPTLVTMRRRDGRIVSLGPAIDQRPARARRETSKRAGTDEVTMSSGCCAVASQRTASPPHVGRYAPSRGAPSRPPDRERHEWSSHLKCGDRYDLNEAVG